MEGNYTSAFTEEERAARRAQRAAARKKKQQERRRRQLLLLTPFFLLGGVFVVLLTAMATNRPAEDVPQQTVMAAAPQLWRPFPRHRSRSSLSPFPRRLRPSSWARSCPAPMPSWWIWTRRPILAEKEARTVISPASMTKILTLLVARSM